MGVRTLKHSMNNWYDHDNPSLNPYQDLKISISQEKQKLAFSNYFSSYRQFIWIIHTVQKSSAEKDFIC